MQKLSGFFLFAILISGVFSSSSAFAQTSPVAEDDFYSVDEDSLLTVEPNGVLENDTNIAQSDTFYAIIQTDVGFGTLTLNQDGSFSYQPNANFDSIDTFTYVAFDGTDNSNEATVTISVNSINDAPIANDDSVETEQNAPIRIDVLENDSDVEGNSLNILLEIDPVVTKGFVEVDGSEVIFTPLADFVGNTIFSYMISDGDKTSNLATVSITVTEKSTEQTIFDQILTQIQSLMNKILSLEDEITTLKDENSALAIRIADLESTIENGVPTNDDGNNDKDHEDNHDDEKVVVCHKGKNSLSISKNALPAHIKHGDTVGKCSDISDNSEIKNQIKELKTDFKIQEKELKKQLHDMKKDKNSEHEEDD